MRPSKLWLFAIGAVLSAGSAFGHDPIYDTPADRYGQRQDLRHDAAQRDRLRSDIARDEARMREAYRCGRWREAEAIERDLNGDYQRLDALNHDIRHDQRDLRYSGYGYRNGGGNSFYFGVYGRR